MASGNFRENLWYSGDVQDKGFGCWELQAKMAKIMGE